VVIGVPIGRLGQGTGSSSRSIDLTLSGQMRAPSSYSDRALQTDMVALVKTVLLWLASGLG